MKGSHLFCLISLLGFMMLLSFAQEKSSNVAALAPVTGARAFTQERLALPAAGRGNPWMNLRDGVELPTRYTGTAGVKGVLEQHLALPTALASADFDEDGVPDLISGYVGPSGGIVTLHRGNVDSIFPNSPEARQRKARGEFVDAPFYPDARVFELPESPDFIGVGDFDADGHWDVVAAARGSDRLQFWRGNGRGELPSAQAIELPGVVTAMVTGEINRRDGLDDVIVGVVGQDGPQVLVFEWPEGALRGQPEVLPMPAKVTALALGQLDESHEFDLVAAAGHELAIIHGRDRSDCGLRIADCGLKKSPLLDQQSFPFVIRSLALGDFIWDRDHRIEIALLTDDGVVHVVSKATGKHGEAWPREILIPGSWPLATQLVRVKISSFPMDDLVVIDPAHHQLHILTAGGSTSRQSAIHNPRY